jgi:Lon protease-like protein
MNKKTEKVKKFRRSLCKQGRVVQVMRSAAGYYIGTIDEDEPYCRLSMEYFPDEKTAQYALENREFNERDCVENNYCNGGIGRCFV